MPGFAEQIESFIRDLPGVFAGMESAVLVGAGGYAHVFRVERPSPLHSDVRETVALKVFGLHALPPAEVAKHFESEKSALARLRGLTETSDDARTLRLVRFHETLQGTWRDRPVFAFVGEYFPDGTLTRWRTGRDRVNLSQLQNLVRDICDGLQFLHERGEVHQDVKPDNIFVVETDQGPDAPDRPRARLGDFGCTRPDGVLTESRTPLFAPDLGEPVDSGGRYDIVSLGCVVAWLIKGKLDPADRRFGKLSVWVLDTPRDRATVIGADARWYRDVTALLLEATRHEANRRPGAAGFGARFDRACEANAKRAHRRQKLREVWHRGIQPLLPSIIALLLVVAATVVASFRHRMPEGARPMGAGVVGVHETERSWLSWLARRNVAEAGGYILLAAESAPDRVRWQLPMRGPVRHLVFAGELPLVFESDSAIVWLDPDSGRMLRVQLGANDAVERAGTTIIPAVPDSPGAALRAVPGGILRWLQDGMLEIWQPTDDGAWIRTIQHRLRVPADNVFWNPETNQLEARLADGATLPIDLLVW